jgi:GAF domain-containing protein
MPTDERDSRDPRSADRGLVDGLAELSALMLSVPDVEKAIADVTVVVAAMLPGDPVVAVTIRRGGDVSTVAATDAHTMLVDEIQYDNGLGPCLQALQTGEPVHVPDLARERRWGAYASRVLAHGVGSVYSHPFRGGGQVVGALNLYAARPHGFDSQSRRMIALTSEHIGTLLDAVVRASEQTRLTEQLRQALESRSVIDQALGIVMARQRCDRTTAFAVLRTASQHRNVRLAELAARIVSTVGGSAPADDIGSAPVGDIGSESAHDIGSAPAGDTVAQG